MFDSYFIDKLTKDTSMDFTLPIEYNPDKIIEVSIKNWDAPTFVVDDKTILSITNIFSSVLNEMNKIYSTGNVFTKPFLSYSPQDNIWKTKIGMMSKVKFEELQKQAENP